MKNIYHIAIVKKQNIVALSCWEAVYIGIYCFKAKCTIDQVSKSFDP